MVVPLRRRIRGSHWAAASAPSSHTSCRAPYRVRHSVSCAMYTALSRAGSQAEAIVMFRGEHHRECSRQPPSTVSGSIDHSETGRNEKGVTPRPRNMHSANSFRRAPFSWSPLLPVISSQARAHPPAAAPRAGSTSPSTHSRHSSRSRALRIRLRPHRTSRRTPPRYRWGRKTTPVSA